MVGDVRTTSINGAAAASNSGNDRTKHATVASLTPNFLESSSSARLPPTALVDIDSEVGLGWEDSISSVNYA